MTFESEIHTSKLHYSMLDSSVIFKVSCFNCSIQYMYMLCHYLIFFDSVIKLRTVFCHLFPLLYIKIFRGQFMK